MHFEPDQLYHVYNLGINTQPIFFSQKNYHYFLKKIRVEWLPYADIIAYSLLPTEIHFILSPNQYGCANLDIQKQESALQKFSLVIGCTLSSYTKAINNDLNRKGCLFHKKTKCSLLLLQPNTKIGWQDAALRMTNLHLKPVSHGLCSRPQDWKFSSAAEYYLNKKGICRKERLYLISISKHKNQEHIRGSR
jgi:putative transposase